MEISLFYPRRISACSEKKALFYRCLRTNLRTEICLRFSCGFGCSARNQKQDSPLVRSIAFLPRSEKKDLAMRRCFCFPAFCRENDERESQNPVPRLQSSFPTVFFSLKKYKKYSVGQERNPAASEFQEQIAHLEPLFPTTFFPNTMGSPEEAYPADAIF